MDYQTRARISEDIRTCEERADEIARNPVQNLEVISCNYLSPDPGDRVLRTTHRDGLLCYYIRWSNFLHRIQSRGYIIIEETQRLESPLPSYLEALVRDRQQLA